MQDYLYDKADALIDDDDFEQAIPLFIKSLNNGNIESAYRLGTIYLDCFEELKLNAPDYFNATKYLRIGAINGHKECQKELGKILLTNDLYRDYPMAVKWLLSSGFYEKSVRVEGILKAIKIIYRNTDLNSVDKLKETISLFNDYIRLTRNKIFLTPVYTYRNELICICARLVIKEAKTLVSLEDTFDYFFKYVEKDFFQDILFTFGTREIVLFLENCNDVHDAENYLLSLDNKDYEYDVKSRGLIYLWLARSYWDGMNNATRNIDKSIKYYLESKSSVANNELEKLLVHHCKELVKINDYESIKKYAKYIQSCSDSYEINHLIEEHDKKVYFEKINSIALTGNVESLLKLAEFYEKGYGTQKNEEKAFEIHKNLYKSYKIKESFDYLFDYYRSYDEKNNLKLLLKDARNNNIGFNYQQEESYMRLIASYATNYYDVIHTKELLSVDTESNIIYYMFDYYKKWWIDTYPNNQFYRDNFFTFISIKKRNYNTGRPLNFPESLYKFFSLLNGEWFICSVPGHEKTSNVSNGVSDIVNMVYLKSNFTLRNTIIQRSYNVDKKATSSSKRNNDYRIDMQSLNIEHGFNVEGKSIIVIDDITTSGSTLIACKNILMNAGAKEVVLVALGKTKEPEYGY